MNNSLPSGKSVQEEVPALWDVKDLAKWGKWPVKQSYEVARSLPPGIAVHFGRRLRFRVDLLVQYLQGAFSQ